ncbi:LysR family transcriptional regulator [Agrobacterium sp. B1(2019)]|uniref:LysR substrate-binding domain-containing protein n=1 Tax=Agrobacterium sp. B1(2019) TaxID=2607032 RepID=UPI0011EEB934|nr:LysR family transcriptional regulator [Agrobacterium sp. B1(2019)]TZG33528.1 LysR family transcriptional regulator [Agrobacterium sp. B1(2019)]
MDETSIAHDTNASFQPRADLIEAAVRPDVLSSGDVEKSQGRANRHPGIAQLLTTRLELRQLRCFLAAVEHGSFRRAADALGHEPSAISRYIRDLEDTLGASLFHRHSHGVKLTVAGSHYLRPVREAFRKLNEGASTVGSIGRGETGEVRIGVASSLASGFLADLIALYQAAHTEVRVIVEETDAPSQIAAVRHLNLDVAFLCGLNNVADCEITPLWHERLFAALPRRHRLADKQTLTWADLSPYSLLKSSKSQDCDIHNHVLAQFANLGKQPNFCAQDVGRDNLLNLVAIGAGISITSEAATALCYPGVTYRVIGGEVLYFKAVWSRHNDNPAFRRLLSLAQRFALDSRRKRGQGG